MKLKIKWKELARQLWNAVKPVLLGAVGGGLVAVTGSGCSSLTPSTKTQTMGVYAFGIPAVAEGVETAQQVSLLKSLGCDIIQGYYFSKPVSADEFEGFIKERIKQ